MDKIIIKDLKVTAILGIYDYERTTPQDILINITMYTDIGKAAKSDNIADCVDYEKAAKGIKSLVETVRRLTAEALSEDIARFCLSIEGVKKVIVRVEKTQAITFTGSVGVEIERTQ